MSGNLAEAVNVFFDRCEIGLPVYVSRMPSMITGLVVGLIVLILGLPTVHLDRRKHEDSATFALEYRWVVLLMGLLTMSYTIMNVVQDQLFLIAMIRENKQHFANTYWVREYLRGLR